VLARKTKVMILALAVVLLPSGLAFGYVVKINGTDTDFQYKRTITIQSGQVISGPHSNFPMLFDSNTNSGLKTDLSSGAGKVRNANGDDVVFAPDDGQEIYKHEIEKYEPSTGEYIAWVRIPSISDGTTFYIYYGSDDTITYPPNFTTDVWDLKYVAVWHLHDDFDDSTSNANNATNFESSDVGGQIADAQDFDGDNDYVNGGSKTSIDNIFNGGGTISAWIYPEGWGGGTGGWCYGRILDKASTTLGYYGWTFFVNNYNDWDRMSFVRDFTLARGFWYTDDYTISLDEWQHVAVAYNDGSTSNVPSMYINGAFQTIFVDTTPNGTREDDQAQDAYIGNFLGGDLRTFDGVIDEVRISTSILPSGWIATEHNNQKTTSWNFYSVSGESTLVELSYFRAKPLNSAVLLAWATQTELDNEGFNILRGEEQDGEYLRISPYLIPARGLAGFGAEYSYTDYDVENGVTYYYLLEDIDFYGKSTLHGPVSATPNDIILIWPIDWETFSSGSSLFSWISSGDFFFKVDVSAGPSFSDSETLSLPDEGWTSGLSLWLRPEEWEMIIRKSRSSGGQLFWRIRAKSQDGRVLGSDWKRFIIEKARLPDR
jgi:biopolymer transport protein ExbB